MPSLTLARALEIAVQQHQAGQLTAARALYRQILSYDPSHANALHLFGVLNANQGDLQTALELIRQAIGLNPSIAAYHQSAGNILKEMGNAEQALWEYQRALELDPTSARTNAGIASLYFSTGRLEMAVDYYGRALASASPDNEPEVAGWHNDLGVALAQCDRLDEALAEVTAALALHSEYAEAFVNLGLILQRQGRSEEAVKEYRKAISICPRSAKAYNNLGISLSKQNRNEEAADALRTAIRLRPRKLSTYVNLAQVLMGLGEVDAAFETCQTALEISPQFGALHQAMGSVLRDTGRISESLAAFDRAIELDPRDPSAHSGRIFARHFHDGSDWRAQAADLQLWNQRHAQHLRDPRPHDHEPAPDRRLRIGYISPDFTQHVLAFLMLPLFSAHDPSQVETYFFCDVANPSALTDRFRKCAHHWIDTVGCSDHQVAEMIRRQKIDILVDLTMHMRNNRLLVFARKPAPIQVTWCYPGSTGLTAMDYRLTDPYLDPPQDVDDRCAEKSIRLADTFFCYDPLDDGPAVSELPLRKNGFITFGCLNNFCKINQLLVNLWVDLLNSIPDSRLLLLSPLGKHRQRVRDALTTQGVAADRLQFAHGRPRPQYLELYHDIDISLDPLPYNGHTTSLDSLWMGVPVITLVGQTVVGRVGLSQLSNLGMTEWVAWTSEEYIDIARRVSSQTGEMAKLRATLRQRMMMSPLMDARRFARSVETAYRQMWRQWCATR